MAIETPGGALKKFTPEELATARRVLATLAKENPGSDVQDLRERLRTAHGKMLMGIEKENDLRAEAIRPFNNLQSTLEELARNGGTEQEARAAVQEFYRENPFMKPSKEQIEEIRKQPAQTLAQPGDRSWCVICSVGGPPYLIGVGKI